jgi:hypothetical protein
MQGSRLVLIGIAATLLSLPASAAGGTRSESFTLTANQQVATLTPKCPRGQRATGGGFRTVAEGPTNDTYLFESRKIGQRRWQVSMRQQGPGVFPLTAFVYCSKDAPKTKTRSTTIALPPGDFFAADASCGGAGKAQAGGFLMQSEPGGNTPRLIDSFRQSRKVWRTRAYAVGPPILTSFVYCADAGPPKARSGSTSTSGFVNATAVSAPCKGGTQLAAGGFSQGNATFSGGFYETFYESFSSAKRWRTSAPHLAPNSTTLTSIAYCA